VWIGQFDCWAYKVGYEFDPVILVSLLENN